MNELKVEHLKGNDSMQEEFIDFVNYVFHMNGKDNDFYRVLPKLYKKEYHPCESNYVTLENGRIVAAVGSFPGQLSVCGTNLSYYGIGNVAVNPYSRSKGYMKKLMNMAVEDMLKEDVDFTLLTGRRNRYSYFSYEIAGRKYSLWLDESNVKHSKYGDAALDYEFIKVTEQDSDILSKIAELQEKQTLHYIRNREKTFDILMTWQPVVYAVLEKKEFAGYLVMYDNSTVKEFLLVHPEKIRETVAAFVVKEKKEGVNFEFPEFQRTYIDAMTELAENVSIQVGENFSVFHYQKVVEAFLQMKAMTDSLMDGEVTLLIHGKRAEERIHISVKNQEISVTATDLPADYVLTHAEAMEFIFHSYCPKRNHATQFLSTWFPLSIYIYPADLV
ncbi:MAG: acetyltransferase, family [Firmicutes bacterium]|nr:acetyltransferase, family [Bacillota bacterium]